jgi:hypothetical protein
LLLIFAAACSDGGGPPAPISPPPVANQSPGGIWYGVRPNGTGIIVLIGESGAIRIIDEFGNQGFGMATVTNQTVITADYLLAPPYGGTLIDGSDAGACMFSGVLQERQTMDYDVECSTSLGGSFGGTILLTYDPVYDMDSSIARIAGTFDFAGDVLTIDVNGAIFLQSGQSGCVVNGQVSLIDTEWNLYGVSIITQNCQAEFAPLNGADWNGLASILFGDGVEVLVGGLTADVNGLPVSLVLALPRI